jgi:hypothetical protein
MDQTRAGKKIFEKSQEAEEMEKTRTDMAARCRE